MRSKPRQQTCGEVIGVEAYWLQHGQWWPDRHQENVAGLSRKHRGLPRAEIDRIYRQLCHVDDCLRDWGAASEPTEEGRAEMLGGFRREFPDLPDEVFKAALYAIRNGL
jgi:hypothetical protein